MFIDWKMQSIKFLAGVLMGLMTVQVLAQVDYDPNERPKIYEKYDPIYRSYNIGSNNNDRELIDYGSGITDSYNWDTNEYQDVEIINDLGNDQYETYNHTTGEYRVITKY